MHEPESDAIGSEEEGKKRMAHLILAKAKKVFTCSVPPGPALRVAVVAIISAHDDLRGRERR